MKSKGITDPQVIERQSPKDFLIKERCEKEHLFFTRYFFSVRENGGKADDTSSNRVKFRVNWHHHYLADLVDGVISGTIKNLVINIAPGGSKTEEMVINFIARGLAVNPHAKFLHISYSDDLTLLNSSRARDLVESDEFQEHWPLPVANDSRSKKQWNVIHNGHKAGGVYAVSLGGQITGFRAGRMVDGFQGCFPVGTRVWTERGLIPIDKIVRERMAVKVWAFDYAGNMVLRDVVAWHENPANEIVRVTFNDGATVECTPDHCFWTNNRGWVRADSLCIEDRLPCVMGGVQHADDIRIDAERSCGWIPSFSVLSTSTCGAIGKSEFCLFDCKFGAQVRVLSSILADIATSCHRLPGIATPYLIYDSFVNFVLTGNVNNGYTDRVVNGKCIVVIQFSARVNFSFAESAMPLTVNDVGDACSVTQIGELIIFRVPIGMADFTSFWARSIKCKHDCPMDGDSPNTSDTHACKEPQMAALFSRQGNNALALGKIDAILPNDRSGFATDAPQIRNAIRTFISGDRSPVFVERVRHDKSTFCLTVDEYHNFTVESGVVVKNCILIDDPLKVKGATSDAERNQANTDILATVNSRRANPDTPIVLIMQRLDVNDPTGFIRKGNLPGEWTFVEIPALIDDTYVASLSEKYQKMIEGMLKERDERGRFSYWPYKERLSDLLQLEKGGIEKDGQVISRRVFSSQYQQKPVIEGGGIIKSEYIKRYKVLPKILHKEIFGDTAQKTEERHDYSVFECWGYGEDSRIYLIDLIRGKWEAPELKRRAIAFWAKHLYQSGPFEPALRKMWIEDKASGTGLVQEIQEDGGIPVEGIQRNKDKYTRWLDCEGYYEAGMVCVPEDAPFTNDYIAESEAFTADDSHEYDDQLDPTFDAIQKMLVEGRTFDEAYWT